MMSNLKAKIKAVFTQNISVEKLTFSVALGIMGGLWPIPGTSTFICWVLAIFVSVNVPAMTLVNLVITPLELAMMPVFIMLGTKLRSFMFHDINNETEPQISNIINSLQNDFFEGIKESGNVLLNGIIAWLICLPFGTMIFYLILKPFIGKLMSIYQPNKQKDE